MLPFGGNKGPPRVPGASWYGPSGAGPRGTWNPGFSTRGYCCGSPPGSVSLSQTTTVWQGAGGLYGAFGIVRGPPPEREARGRPASAEVVRCDGKGGRVALSGKPGAVTQGCTSHLRCSACPGLCCSASSGPRTRPGFLGYVVCPSRTGRRVAQETSLPNTESSRWQEACPPDRNTGLSSELVVHCAGRSVGFRTGRLHGGPPVTIVKAT